MPHVGEARRPFSPGRSRGRCIHVGKVAPTSLAGSLGRARFSRRGPPGTRARLGSSGPRPTSSTAMNGRWSRRRHRRPVENPVAELDEAGLFPRLRPGCVDLEDERAWGQRGPALGKGVEAGSEQDVLGNVALDLLFEEVFDQASTGHDACTERSLEGPSSRRGRRPGRDSPGGDPCDPRARGKARRRAH